MSIGLIGKKVGMTQIFTQDEAVVPCTVIQAGPCFVTQIKTGEKEGYKAVQLGFDTQKIQRQTLPRLIHIQRALGNEKEKVKTEQKKKSKEKEFTTLKVLKEFRDVEVAEFKLGQQLTVELFEPEESVIITGISKGKGFQGVMKRHNYSGGGKSHGAHKWHRRPGGIAMCATPGRVFKGKKMPGRMGADQVTLKKVKIVSIDPEKNLILVKGSIPGSINGYVTIKKSK